ncbi:cytochrome o ubiquinol oxidase subunit IV [Roseateles sp.]|uniref:cytochrome o ubiquinol oxidase subunit IV n=1 Tax=Roseateles sp. TaxID=1971397 RepID=UPI003263CF4B
MTDEIDQRHAGSEGEDETPGETPELRTAVAKYLAGLLISVALTLASFWVAGGAAVWGPGIDVLLAALAVGQMGVHLVFFLHLSSGPDNTNNILALAFGVFVVALLVFGSLIIMANLDAHMVAPEVPLQGQR